MVEALGRHHLGESALVGYALSLKDCQDVNEFVLADFLGGGVGTEGSYVAGNIDCALVHGIAHGLSGVAADDDAALLHHEAGEESGVAADDQRAAFHGDAGPGPGVAMDHQLTAPHGGACGGPGVLSNGNFAAHQVVADGPARVAFDNDFRPVQQAGGIVADTALEPDGAVLEDSDGEVVAGVGVENGNLGAGGGQFLEPSVQRPGVQVGGVYSNQVMTSLFCGSARSISWSKTPRRAISSEAMAITSSVSMVTSGLADHWSLA